MIMIKKMEATEEGNLKRKRAVIASPDEHYTPSQMVVRLFSSRVFFATMRRLVP
jgi:hypothetical protein